MATEWWCGCGARRIRKAALLLLALLLAGCNTYISENEYDSAQLACAKHGGVRRIHGTIVLFGAVFSSALCADGMRVDWRRYQER